jgi:hypothetical protein
LDPRRRERHLARPEAAHQAEDQRRLRILGETRVAAAKHDAEKVRVGIAIRWVHGQLLGVKLDLAVASPHLAAPEHIAGAVLRHPEQPRCGVGR